MAEVLQMAEAWGVRRGRGAQSIGGWRDRWVMLRNELNPKRETKLAGGE